MTEGELIRLWKGGKYRIPQSSELVKRLLDEMEKSNKLRTEDIKSNFSNLVENLQKDVYKMYLKLEKEAVQRLLNDYFSRFSSGGTDCIIREFGKHIHDLDKLFLSLSQSRRSRAGKAFEDILKVLFKMLEYPFDEKPVIDGRPDFILPSKEHYKTNAMDCIIFTSKRTLRERWRQIVTEGTRGLGFFLATIDEDVSKKGLGEMKNHRIWIVVPERIKKKHYPDAINAITFEEFFEDHLDPKVKSWKRNDVI